MNERTIQNESQMETVADEVLSVLPQKESAHVLALSGELGAGKTAFTKALAQKLGITEHITSPTFVIMKMYEVPKHPWITRLVHIDAYRVEESAELDILKLPELYQTAGTLICIEWPELMKDAMPQDAFKIHIKASEGDERTIIYGS